LHISGTSQFLGLVVSQLDWRSGADTMSSLFFVKERLTGLDKLCLGLSLAVTLSYKIFYNKLLFIRKPKYMTQSEVVISFLRLQITLLDSFGNPKYIKEI